MKIYLQSKYESKSPGMYRPRTARKVKTPHTRRQNWRQGRQWVSKAKQCIHSVLDCLVLCRF